VNDLLALDFMRQALLAALLAGFAAPLVGVFLVQRRMSLIGDGMGHVALAGVAVGVLTGAAPVLTALVAAIAAAVLIEVVRARGRTSGDVALAVLFYGGIAAGVVIISRSTSGTPTNLTSYLFGAITTTSRGDLWVFAALAVVVVATTWTLRPRLFAVANDEEYARATGMRVTALNVTLAVLTAVTVVVAMRVVGLLLISALMIVPNAVAQLLCRSFRTSLVVAVTVLTSFDETDLRQMGYSCDLATLVELRVRNAMDAGIDGVVCSALEAAQSPGRPARAPPPAAGHCGS